MEDRQGDESERVECDAHVTSGQLHCESDAVGSTDSHKDVPQNGSTAQLDTTSSDEEDNDDWAHAGGGYVLLSQDDLLENSTVNEICSCIDDCTATVEVLPTDESSTCLGEVGLQTETQQSDVTRFADPGAVIVPVTKMEGEEASAIMKAMSGFNLPATVTPDWAKVIPEDVWKAELLAGLRNNSKHH
eukprot:Em0019g884a